MSAIHTWVCFLVWIGFSTQNKTPDVTVTCFVSEVCLLPCSFQPDSLVNIEWFRQDESVLKFEQDDKDDSSEERVLREDFDGRVSIFPSLVSRGNATLTLKKSSLRDRGTYRCRVRTSKGEENAKVILKVEAPIRGLSLELSRMSGYEEMICTANNVYPAPRVSWTTEPSTFEDLRPVTRVHSNKDGLYEVNSRLKLLTGRPNLIYICKVSTSYGGPAWTASLRAREIRGSQGKDLTVPCLAPPYLNHPTLEWNFNNGPDSSHILTYNSQSGRSNVTLPWNQYVELDGYRVPFGDGSLRLMDPVKSKHTGIYTCRFYLQYNTHTERSDVIIGGPDDSDVFCVFSKSCILPCTFQPGADIVIHWIRTPNDVPVHSYYQDEDQLTHQNSIFKDRTSLFQDQIKGGNASLLLKDVSVRDEGRYKCYTSTIRGNNDVYINMKVDDKVAPDPEIRDSPPSHWWIAGVVIAVLALVVVAAVLYLKRRGTTESKAISDPERLTEMTAVKEAKPEESSPLNEDGAGR